MRRTLFKSKIHRATVTHADLEYEGSITLDERVTSADLRSGHHSAQLIERVGWAVHDADDVERADVETGDPPSARSRTSARRAKALTN